MSDDRGWIVAFYSRSQNRKIASSMFGDWKSVFGPVSDVGPSPTAALHALMRWAEFSLFDGGAVVAAVEFRP